MIRDRIRELVRVPASSLLANPKNWRTHPKAQAAAMTALLGEIGYADALIARETPEGLVLIDGHLRAETTPDDIVPVLIRDVTEAEADKLLLTLDPLAAMAEADKGLLGSLLASVEAGSDAVGRMLEDLARREHLAMAREGLTNPDAVPPVPEEPTTKPGDLWLLGEHRLLCGDATKAEDVERLMDGQRADCVFTSPPYGVGIDYGTYEDTIPNLRVLLRECSERWRSVVVDGGFAVVNFGDVAGSNIASGADGPCEYPMALEYWPAFRANDWLLWSRRAWCKPNPRVHSPWCIQSNRAATDWEHVWTFKAPGDAIIKRVDGEMSSAHGWFDTTHLEGVAVGKESFGAGMASAAAERMVAIHSTPRGIVHEPFTGTGTTLIACERLGRRCYAIEIEPRYVDVAVRRWEQYTGQTAVLDG